MDCLPLPSEKTIQIDSTFEHNMDEIESTEKFKVYKTLKEIENMITKINDINVGGNLNDLIEVQVNNGTKINQYLFEKCDLKLKMMFCEWLYSSYKSHFHVNYLGFLHNDKITLGIMIIAMQQIFISKIIKHLVIINANIFLQGPYFTNYNEIIKYYANKDEDLRMSYNKSSLFILNFALKHKLDLEFIKHLVEQGANVNARDKYSLSVLHTAVKHANSIELIEYLVQQGADINAKAYESCSIVHTAVKYKNEIGIIKYLVEQGAHANAKNDKLWSVLHTAVQYRNDIEIVKYLVEQGADVNAKKDNSWSVLHTAVEYGNELEIIKYLVKKGADVNAKDNQSCSVLHRCVESCNETLLVKYLVDHGAYINAKNNDSESVLHVALQFENDVKVIKCLVENGAKINAKDNKARSILCTAVENRYVVELVEYLVEQGADINEKDYQSRSILLTAVKKGYGVELIKYLVDHGAHINAGNIKNVKTIKMAAADKSLEVLRYIMENQQSKITAKQIAAKSGKADNYEALVMNSQRNDLRAAVESNHINIIRKIYELYSVVKIDSSLIYKSICNESPDVLKLLLEKVEPSSLLSINNYSEDITTIAKRQKNKEILNIVQKYLSAVERILKLEPKEDLRYDDTSIKDLISLQIFLNIFDAHKFAGIGGHETGGERDKLHGNNFSHQSIMNIFCYIIVNKIKCEKISIENSLYGAVDDLVLEQTKQITCIQLKHNEKGDPIKADKLFGTFNLAKHFISIVSKSEKLVCKPVILVLLTNRPIEVDINTENILEIVPKFHLEAMYEYNEIYVKKSAFNRFPSRFKVEYVNENFMNPCRKAFNDPKNKFENVKFETIFKFFFANLVVIPNQLDETDLQSSVTKKLKQIMPNVDSEKAYKQFLLEVALWYNKDKDNLGIIFSDESVGYYFQGLPKRLPHETYL